MTLALKLSAFGAWGVASCEAFKQLSPLGPGAEQYKVQTNSKNLGNKPNLQRSRSVSRVQALATR